MLLRYSRVGLQFQQRSCITFVQQFPLTFIVRVNSTLQYTATWRQIVVATVLLKLNMLDLSNDVIICRRSCRTTVECHSGLMTTSRVLPRHIVFSRQSLVVSKILFVIVALNS
jgi:hypothetical protein